VSILEAIVLGLVQGLTEFIPISSTAHLKIVPVLLGWGDPGAAASAVIQLGTVAAVIIYFFRDIVRIALAWFRGLVIGKPFAHEDSRLGWYIIIGSIPIVVLGILFKNFIETTARSLWIIAFSLVFVAVLLMIAEKYAARFEARTIQDLNMRDAVAIGFGQAMALIPGMSRSGSTIMTSLFRKFTREAAARFSFLLSIPAITGAALFQMREQWDHLGTVGWTPILVATVVAFASGWASIWFLLRYLRTHTTAVFIWYRIALAVVLAGLLAAGVLTPYQ